MRIPVLSEQGTADGRSDAEKRVIERHTADKQRTRVLPMFMDKTAFARSAGLTNIEQPYAVVLKPGRCAGASRRAVWCQQGANAARDNGCSQIKIIAFFEQTKCAWRLPGRQTSPRHF